MGMYTSKTNIQVWMDLNIDNIITLRFFLHCSQRNRRVQSQKVARACLEKTRSSNTTKVLLDLVFVFGSKGEERRGGNGIVDKKWKRFRFKKPRIQCTVCIQV